jgi:hypothetical protein
MQLAKYMQDKELDDEAFAGLLNACLAGEARDAANAGPPETPCSPWAVRKWRYRQRVPRPEMQRRIAKITDDKVTPNDWMDFEPAQAAAS